MTRRAFDNYATDPGLARWAVQRASKIAILPEEGDAVSPPPVTIYPERKPTILEPCCGDRAPFAVAGQELGMVPYGYDIRDVTPPLWSGDLGESDGRMWVSGSESFPRQEGVLKGYDIIATNPPFNSGEEVVRRSLELLNPCGCAVFLTKMAFLSTQKRSQLFIDRPPLEVWILRARPSFTGDGGTDIGQEYCFTFWGGPMAERFMRRAGDRRTTLNWFDNASLMGKPKRVRIAKKGGQDG